MRQGRGQKDWDLRCNDFKDTSQLRPFSLQCPKEYNACYAVAVHPDLAHLWRHSMNSIRSCMQVPPGKLASFKEDPRCFSYIPEQDISRNISLACPCFTDNCNVGNVASGPAETDDYGGYQYQSWPAEAWTKRQVPAGIRRESQGRRSLLRDQGGRGSPGCDQSHKANYHHTQAHSPWPLTGKLHGKLVP
ncbi:hypothetical protein RvY_03174 [Ramazzottius varieornatus]|uniref:Uncharacterized protein n=1 Tax=Ramazzottius varieornatus TaxID=947166 RepID=A0A1D1UM46_RAMVA|nr:hypothetical protein RvY_03174 [Ramazzottius varieornatus]